MTGPCRGVDARPKSRWQNLMVRQSCGCKVYFTPIEAAGRIFCCPEHSETWEWEQMLSAARAFRDRVIREGPNR